MKKLLFVLVVIVSQTVLASPPPPAKVSDAQNIYDNLDTTAQTWQGEDNVEISTKTIGCFSCDKTMKPGLKASYLCGIQMNSPCDSFALYSALKVKVVGGYKSIGGLTCAEMAKGIADCQYFH